MSDLIKRLRGYPNNRGHMGMREAAADKIERLTAENSVLSEALNHVIWVKYCGIDGRDTDGVYKNFPEQERNSMYDIALKVLQETGRLSDNMKDAASIANPT
jgi:hypothetical protein